jgi:hypothetical protein
MEGSVDSRVFALLGSVIKTQHLSDKVISGGFVDVNKNFIPVVETPVTPPAPVFNASITRAGLYYVGGVANMRHPVKAYVNNRFIGWVKYSYNETTNNYSFGLVLGRRYFVRGWNVVSIRDGITGQRLDARFVRRIL